MSKGRALFKVDCPQLGFSRSWEMPIHSGGYVRELVENLEKAMDFYKLRVEAHKAKNVVRLAKEEFDFGNQSSYNALVQAVREYDESVE